MTDDNCIKMYDFLLRTAHTIVTQGCLLAYTVMQVDTAYV